MAEVRVSSHDFRVFVRRLMVPGELGRDLNAILLPSQVAGLFPIDQDPTKRADVQKAIKDASTSGNFASLASKLFSDYNPPQFKADVIAKATTVAEKFKEATIEKREQLQLVKAQIKSVEKEIVDIKAGKSIINELDDNDVTALSLDQAYYLAHKDDQIVYDSTPQAPGAKSPRENDIGVFSLTKTKIKDSTGVFALSPFEKNTVDQINTALDILLTGTPDATAVSDLYVLLSNEIGSLLKFMSHGRSNTLKISELNATLSILNQQAQSLEQDILILDNSSPLRPFYEPILLSSMIGPTQVQTTINRMGQPGTASVTFHLPLDGNGAVPDLFLGLKVEDIFSLSLYEGAPGKTASVKNFNILTANKRETTLLPFDMIQVWGRKKLATGSTFPGDYAPVFTGFITKTNVGYSGSSISVTVSAEDVGKMLRLARVNIDPNLDPRFRAPGINVTPYNNVLASPQFKTGADLIQGLIVGTPGTFLGLSQVEVLTKVEQVPNGGQTIQTSTTTTKRVSVAADFENLKLNLFQDLLTRWKPYASQFKNAFRLWETDARNKWDICREVADVTEFEFYVDSTGVVNYHPPLYFLNPFAAQYFIENVDIDSENHMVDESEVLTVVEVQSQPSFVANASALDSARRNSSLIAAADAVIQRFGVRWQKKSVPIFSGTEQVENKNVDQKLLNKYRDAGRDGYARAWMNRRNARLKSATVTINGTPEIRLCNTVAFVGDLQNTLKIVATNQMAAAASNLSTIGGVSTLNFSLSSLSPGAIAALKDVMVYYVTAITHTYSQGGSYKTTLTLTHGRHWTDPLPQGSVGFSLDANDTDTVVAQMRLAFGQNGVDADAFAREVNNKIQFIASGNPAFLKPQTSGIFGLYANKPKTSVLERFRSSLSSEINGAIERARAQFCRKLLRSNDPKDVASRAKEQRKSVSQVVSGLYADAKKAISDAGADLINSIKKLGVKALEFLADAEKKLLTKGEKLINDAQEKAFNAILGGKSFKILTETTAGTFAALPTAALQPLSLAGVNVDQIKSAATQAVGVVIFTYLVKSESSYTDAVATADMNLAQRATDLLKPKNPGQLLFLGDAVLLQFTITKPPPIGTALVGGKPSVSKTIYFIQGVSVMAVKPTC